MGHSPLRVRSRDRLAEQDQLTFGAREKGTSRLRRARHSAFIEAR